ncbi:branched-chain amino acid ABC transporter ATP-binding protein [Bradyrhizobium sp. NAS80.1]|uniref:ABC transporter ATP-binding protein n=1 Tax=Bradyrhizobium sp. NAS80.1 TaxID=1680159 RepID=UPI0009693960|nr:ABC transporter ATP-binding protein [Bradyrhizobium sp. NAS80.1]OKO87835.1 branched-chain amino acid ABC transporter ATP-binding protein [Bradyrhizobium sp. NAS80.1]
MLEVENLQVVYNNAIEAVRNASLAVGVGGMTALLGANGAGKTTLLKAISGVLYPEDGSIREGLIKFEGHDLTSLAPDEIVRLGIAHVPEGRRLFIELTVEENLVVGGHIAERADVARRLEEIYALFPRIKDKRAVLSGYLSGGEQQMVAIGRALMTNPRLLMLDEPSLGIAPLMAQAIYAAVERLCRDNGLTVLLVEQNAQLALDASRQAYVLENGRVVLDGTSDELKRNEDICEFYLGLGAKGDRRSMREVKHYKRRKRWLS